MIAKTDDEVYVFSIIKVYSYFSFVFSTEPKKFELLKISEVMKLFWKSLPPCKNGREEDNNFFGQSLLHLVVFKKKISSFLKYFSICRLQLPNQLLYDCMNISALKYYQNYSRCLLACRKQKLKNLLSSVLEELLWSC